LLLRRVLLVQERQEAQVAVDRRRDGARRGREGHPYRRVSVPQASRWITRATTGRTPSKKRSGRSATGSNASTAPIPQISITEKSGPATRPVSSSNGSGRTSAACWLQRAWKLLRRASWISVRGAVEIATDSGISGCAPNAS